MTVEEFKATLNNTSPPQRLHPVLLALWYDAKGYWHKAHETVQELAGKEAALIHAYLHRMEGDLINAEYWYYKASSKIPDIPGEAEWENLLNEFIDL